MTAADPYAWYERSLTRARWREFFRSAVKSEADRALATASRVNDGRNPIQDDGAGLLPSCWPGNFRPPSHHRCRVCDGSQFAKRWSGGIMPETYGWGCVHCRPVIGIRVLGQGTRFIEAIDTMSIPERGVDDQVAILPPKGSGIAPPVDAPAAPPEGGAKGTEKPSRPVAAAKGRKPRSASTGGASLF
jgi:hypothetical protein